MDEITISPIEKINKTNEGVSYHLGYSIMTINTYISLSLYSQFMELESYDHESGWSTFTITKEEMEKLDCTNFNENDFNLIRLFYNIINMGIMIYIDIIT